MNRKYKTKYRVTNWREYERGLRSRGDITVWFKIVIPPRRGAVASGCVEGTWAQRNATLETICKVGCQGWQRELRYRRQGAVENLFFRYKRTLGNSLRACG